MNGVIPEQDKFENLDDSSKIVMDGATGLAQRLGKDGPEGDLKPLSELTKVDMPEDPKPKAKNFSAQAKKDQNLDGHGDSK